MQPHTPDRSHAHTHTAPDHAWHEHAGHARHAGHAGHAEHALARDAAAAYTRALELATNPVERRFLERRLAANPHGAAHER